MKSQLFVFTSWFLSNISLQELDLNILCCAKILSPLCYPKKGLSSFLFQLMGNISGFYLLFFILFHFPYYVLDSKLGSESSIFLLASLLTWNCRWWRRFIFIYLGQLQHFQLWSKFLQNLLLLTVSKLPLGSFLWLQFSSIFFWMGCGFISAPSTDFFYLLNLLQQCSSFPVGKVFFHEFCQSLEMCEMRTGQFLQMVYQILLCFLDGQMI